ncbi:MAG: major facilitator superfamily 1 [Bacillales bacterium]|jgi:DHA3 family macrolide efflux protein-like MFS transporter|nr:major facilitator superfamily 1 [Bacillales bacterium]
MENSSRNIRNYLTGIAITTFGSYIVMFAVIWYITLETKSGLMMTISTVCSTIPQLIISPIAGVWADRYDRKKIIIASDLAIAFATLALAVVFMAGYEARWLVFVIVAIRSLGAGIQMPAAGAYVAQFVPKDDLMKVNSGITTIQSTSQLIAPPISAALLSFASITAIFFIDVFTAIIGCLMIARVVAPAIERKAVEKATSAWIEMKEGFNYVKGHPYIKDLMLFFAVFMLFIGPSAMLTPLHVTLKFGSDEWRLAAMEMAFSIGMILGGLVLTAWGGFKNRILSMALSCIGFGVFTILLGVVPNFFIYISLFTLMGFGLPYFNTPSVTMIQESVDPEVMGRVMSLFGMVTSTAFPISMMIFGPMADFVKIEWLLIGTGIVITVLGVRVWMDKKLQAKTTAPAEVELVEDVD